MSKAKDALKNAFKTALYFLPFAHALKAMEWISSVTSATKLIFAKSLITGLTSKGTPALSQNFGAKLSFRSPTAPRQIIYGKARVGATIVFVETTGTDNYLLHMVMVFSGHEVEELVSVRFNDTNLTSTTSTINGSTVHTVTNSKYVNSDNENKLTSGGALIRYTFEDGSQTAANGFMAAQTSLTTNHKFKDCSYLYVQMAYDAEAFSGIPNISAVIKGKKCYDPRTGNTVWTDNPALHVRDYLSNTTYGLKATTSELNDANSSGGFWSAANICEQTVNLPDSATEQRYTGNGSTNMTARGDQVLEGLLSSMSGKLTYTNGKFNVFPGTAQTPSLSITDTELLSPMEIITNSTTGDLYNSVKPIFVDASTNYTPTDAPIYENSTFLSEDTPSGESNSNYVKRLEPNLAFTTTNTMAQRLGRIMLNDQRQTVGLSCLVSLKYMQLQPNDWVQITNSRLSYTNKNFQVVTTNLEILEEDGVPIAATRLELREIDSSIYTFGTSDYGTMVSEGASVGTGDLSVSPPSGLAVSAELVVIGYDLEVTWTNNSSDAVQGTEIKYGTSSGTYIGSVTAGKGQSKIIVPNLKANTTYYVSARHFSSNNVFSSFTSEVTINTGSSSDIATPSAPSNLSVTTNKPLQIGVTWTSPSNTDTRAVKVYRKTSNVTPTDDTNLVETVACEPGTTQKVTYGKEDGLTAGTTYYFWVRAISFSEKHSAFAGSQSGTFGDVTGSDISTSTTITAGTGNNVGVLDGADSTYRIYAGHATPGSAPFRVTQAGVLTATNATITGNVTANSLNVTGATVTGTLDASVITLNGNALSGLMGSSGTGSSTVLAVGPDVKNQIKVGSSSVEYIAYDDVTEQGHKALDMQFGSTTYYPTASVTGWQSTIINPGNGSNTGYLSAPSYILQNAGSSVTSTTNRLYNLNGTLYWDGNVVGLGSGTITGVVAGTNLNGGGTSGSVTLNLDSTITGNHTFSNNVVIGGDLTVQGTTTTIDTTNLDVKDKNITLNYGSGDTSGNADGAGITIQDAVDASTNATLLWDASNDRFDFSHDLKIISTNRDMLHLRRNASSGDAGINFENTSGNLAQIYAMSTGNVVIDAVADITLDAAGNQIFFKDAGTTVGTVSMTDSNLKIISNVSDKDMIFAGTDGGSEVVALTLDMSNAGNAIFNSGGEFHGSLHLDADSAQLQLGDDNDMQVYHNGAHGAINVGTGNLTLDVAGDIALDADGGDIKFQDAGTDIFSIINSSSDVQLKAAVQDKDMQFRGNDGGSIITALTLDMSDAGTATFNHDVLLGSSGRIGIGISPAEMLDIQSASGDARIRLDAPASSDTEIKFFNDGSAQYTIGHDDATDNFVIGGANVDAPLVSVDKSGNVGISTTTPNYLLDVEGTGSLFRINSTSGAAALQISVPDTTSINDINFGDSGSTSSGQIRYRHDGDSMAFSTGGVERARLSGAGVLSIGTTSTTPGFSTASGIALHPSDMSHISRNAGTPLALNRGGGHGDVLNLRSGGSSVANIGTSTTGIYIDSNLAIGATSGDNKVNIQESALSGRSASNSNTSLTLEHATDTGIQFFSATQTQLRFGDASDTGSGAIIYTHSDNILRLSSASAHRFTIGGTEAMRIDSSGSVGISTDSPWSSTKLDLSTSGDARMRRLYIYDSNRYFIKDNYGIEYNTTQSSGFHKFVINSSEIARIDSTGLGIGTTSAGAAVDIINSGLVTQLRLSNTASDSTTKYGAIVGRHYDNSEEPVAGLLLTSSSNATAQAIDIGGGISAANMVNQIIFHTASNNTTTGSNERMRIDNNGRIGIGVQVPDNVLHVKGSADSLVKVESTDETVRIDLTDNGGTSRVANVSGALTLDADATDSSSSSYMNFKVDGSEVARITSNGRLGIATDAPSNKLEIKADSDHLRLIGSTTDTKGLSIRFDHSNNRSEIRSDQTGVNQLDLNYYALDHRFGRNGSLVYMTITELGAVGIGTDAPNALLNLSHATAPTFRLSRTGIGQIWEQTIDSSGRFHLQEAASEGGTKYTRLQVDDTGEITFNGAYTFPTADGVTGSFLKTDGSGNLSWSSNTITSFSNPGTGYLITSDSSSSSGVSGEPTLQYEGAYDGLTLLESGGHNAYLSFGASDDTTATGQIRFYSASTPVTLTGAAGELQLTNGDFSVADSKKLKLGSDGDLEIYHDGLNSFISEVGTGNFYIQGAGTIRIRGATTEENMIEAVENGAVTLYYNNSAKLATTSGGVDVTGSLDINSTTAGATVATFEGSYSSSGDVKLASFERSGSAVAAAIEYNDATTDMEFGTTTSHNFSLKAGDSRIITIDTDGHFYILSGNLKMGTTNVLNSGRVLYNLEQIKLNDSKDLVLGTGNDFKIYHSGSHGFLDLVGDGALKIKGDDIRFENASGTEAVRITDGGTLWTNYGNPDSSSTVIIDKDGSGTAGLRFYNAASNTAKVELDSSENLLINSTNNLTLDVGGGIDLDSDGGQVSFKDAGVLKALIDITTNDVEIQSRVTDADLKFRGQDGTSFITALTLDMSDAGAATFNNNVTAYSDERLKDNIETLDGKKVLDMRGVSFTRDGKEGSGVIAQELEQVAPELVKTADDEMGTKSVAYGNMVGYLIENAKRQEELIKELREEINKLKGEKNGD